MPTAILIDAGFFLKRFSWVWPAKTISDASAVARTLHEMAFAHLTQKASGREVRRELYRIFVYDCPPLSKKAHLPISRKAIDFSRTPIAEFRRGLHSELGALRKVALRLGELRDGDGWRLHPQAVKDLLAGRREVSDLADHDFAWDTRQKGVDIRIGLDIASITMKRQADQIVLVSGDADFVPAAKLARREGVDFILDPMWQQIAPDLNEHVDGIQSRCPKPNSSQGSHVASQ